MVYNIIALIQSIWCRHSRLIQSMWWAYHSSSIGKRVNPDPFSDPAILLTSSVIRFPKIIATTSAWMLVYYIMWITVSYTIMGQFTFGFTLHTLATLNVKGDVWVKSSSIAILTANPVIAVISICNQNPNSSQNQTVEKMSFNSPDNMTRGTIIAIDMMVLYCTNALFQWSVNSRTLFYNLIYAP